MWSGRTDSTGHGLWADGISFDCTNYLVSNNTVCNCISSFSIYVLSVAQITGSTDGGTVIFGPSGSIIQNNVITSSATNTGLGAINMVDNENGGIYAGVTVIGNTIKGTNLFNLGICIGANIWPFNDPNQLSVAQTSQVIHSLER